MKAIYNFFMRIVLLQLMLMMIAAAYANSPDKDTLSGDPKLSIHPAPEMKVQYDPVQPNALLAGESPAYGNDVWAGILFTIDPADPASTTGIGAVTFQSASGDFLPDDPGHLLVLDLVDNHLKRVDVATAGVVNSTPMAPATADEVWTVLSTDKTTMSDMYAISTTGAESFLYQVDPFAGTAELLTPLGIGAVISGTFAGDPGVMLVLDALTDVCYSINVADATVTELGPAGFDANFAQGMAYDPVSGNVYLAAFHNDVGPELRQMNVLTGETTLLGSLNGETTAFAFPVPTGDNVLFAGQDQYLVTGGSFSFGEEGDFPPLPPDFFGPGSEPFTGPVPLTGQHSDGGQLPLPDLTINRPDDLLLPLPLPSTGTVDVEIVELGLRSVEPIAVNIGGVDSFFDVFVTLQMSAPQNGNADITQENDQGGIFGMNLFFYPVFTFVNVDNPSNEIIFDPFEEGLEPLPLLPPDPMDWMLPPVPGGFDPFFPGPEPLLTPSGSGINVLPLLMRDDQVFLSMNQEGVPEEWGGSGYNDGEWFYYPNFDWWNVWFYDHPVDVTRRKLVGGFLEILPRDPSAPSYVEIVINWSTPQWPGFPETLRPPLPEDVQDPAVEQQMIERSETIFLFEGGTIEEPIPVEIPSDYLNNNTNLFNFNPEWLSIDLRGYNFQLQGDIVHICFKPYDGCSFEIICPDDIEVCFTDDPFTLAGGSPAGGTYSGPGVVGGTVFDPSTASWGSNTITYTYTDDSGCTKSCQFTIYVIPPPEMVCPPNMIVCADDNSVSLSGGIPAGGTYSGPGVNGNTFFPSAAGLGTHTITYAVTDPCPGLCTFTIQVVAPPELVCPEDFTICQNEDPINLQNYVSPPGGTFLGGDMFDPGSAPVGIPLQTNYTYTDPETGCDASCTFYITVLPVPEVICPDDMEICFTDDPVTLTASPSGGTYSGNGISGNTFDPSGASWGSNTITYTYVDDNGCEASCQFTIYVIPPPEMVCPFDLIVCLDDGPVTLSGGQPAGGTYSGPGVNGGIFFPSSAGLGAHEITYSVTDPCPGSCTFTITVVAPPEITCPDDFTMCADDAPINLQNYVSPSGGTFIGGDIFNPATAPPGVPLQFNYTYTDPATGCDASCTFYITVYPEPEVICPDDMVVCEDDPVIDLSTLGASPSGGTFTDALGNIITIFDPAGAGPASYLITYTYTDPQTGCTGECEFAITVYPNPEVDCPDDMTLCEGDGEVTLSASPAGGTFSGPGVDGSTFDPADAGAGVHTIEYCYTDPDTGCEGCCEFTVTVHPEPDVVCPQNMMLCVDDFPVNLSGTPAGGTFSGPGISGNQFDPANAGVGVHTIEYCYTDPDTGCEGCCEFTIIVNPKPDVTCPPDMHVCIDDAPFNLTGATPPGGSYNDVNFNPVNPFDPAAFGVGVHTIYYDYTDPNTGCYNFCTFTVTVHDLPVVTCPPNMSVCEDDPQFQLMGATPAGGIYAGPGVVGINQFNPSAVGPGLYFITYTYTDQYGCSNSCVFSITVNPLPNVICPPDDTVCFSDNIVPLPAGMPAGGTYAGPGVVGGNGFNAAQAGVGTHTLIYTWTNPVTGCSNSCAFLMTVVPAPVVICPPNMSVCENSLPFPLAGATPAGGTYFDAAGNPIVNFNPAWGPGSYPITYVYTDPQTGCTGQCTFTITVNPLPVVNCPADTSICEGNPVFMLTGATPAGGVYSGIGVNFVAGNYWYDPSVWGLGTVTITYTFTDPSTGCVNSCNFDITTNALPVVDCPADMTVCASDAPFVLTGGEPEGGTYTDPAGNPIVAFDPSVGAGVYPITYTWTDPATGCANSCTFTITVAQGPSVDCPPDIEVCFNDAPFALTGAVPNGGIYAGPGVSGGIFYPAVAGIGAHLITYTFTDPQTGCLGSCTFSVIVNADQFIELTQGWNGISTYLTPDDPDIVNMFAPIENSLTILYNLNGLNSTGTLYWPSQGIMPTEDWDVYSGYFIKVGDPVDLILCGLEVIDKTLQLPQGWSLIPVLSPFDVNVEDLFDNVDELVVVKDAAGPGVYWPAFNINSLGHVKPGHSYLVYLSGDADITYPTSQANNAMTIPDKSMPDHPWGEIAETPASHVVVFNVGSSMIESGDVIGGFNSSGQLAGVMAADVREAFVISLYGNDPFAQATTGFDEGEEFSFRLFRPSTGETYDLEAVYNPEMNAGSFTANGLSEVVSIKASATSAWHSEGSGVEIFPNPSDGAFNIGGIEGIAKVSILNAFGKEIFKDDVSLPAEIDLISQPKGMYVVVIRTFEGQETIRKLIIN